MTEVDSGWMARLELLWKAWRGSRRMDFEGSRGGSGCIQGGQKSSNPRVGTWREGKFEEGGGLIAAEIEQAFWKLKAQIQGV